MPLKFRLKAVLADRDKTQRWLAEETGVRPPTISAFATGTIKHIPSGMLESVCKALNCQPGDLIQFIDDTKGGEE